MKKSGKFSPIWIIPVVAALLGLWLAFKYYSARGPEITVRFETAEGIVEGKTPVLCRSVNIGTVDNVRLTKDLKGVIVTMQMTSEATDLLTKDTQIWVVRPRYGGAAGISGLSTIVSGSYIALEPGISEEPRREFVGLEQPPVTPKGVPGLHITLFTDEAGSIGPGRADSLQRTGGGQNRVAHFSPGEWQDRVWRFYLEDSSPRLCAKTRSFGTRAGSMFRSARTGCNSTPAPSNPCSSVESRSTSPTAPAPRPR